MSPNVPFAHDLAQEVVIKAFKGFHNYQDQGQGVMPWISVIIRNTFNDLIKKQGKIDEKTEWAHVDEDGNVDYGFDAYDFANPNGSPEVNYIDALGVARIVKAIDELPEEYRQSVRMNLLANMTYKEIADELGANPITVGTRISKGRALLTKVLAQEAAEFGIVKKDKKKK